ncbi:hypothetical protein ACOME3_007488 [Neoechinorhynchus agilis]
MHKDEQNVSFVDGQRTESRKRRHSPAGDHKSKRIKMCCSDSTGCTFNSTLSDHIIDQSWVLSMMNYAACSFYWSLIFQQAPELLLGTLTSQHTTAPFLASFQHQFPTVSSLSCDFFKQSLRTSEAIQTIDGVTRYKCPECPKHYSSANSLRRHFINHTNDKTKYQCPQCQKPFTRSDALKTHQKRCHSSTLRLLSKSLRSMGVQTDPV